MVLVTFQGSSQAVAFSLLTKKLACKIDEGGLGCVKAIWSPDGLHILTFSDMKVRDSSLLSQSRARC